MNFGHPANPHIIPPDVPGIAFYSSIERRLVKNLGSLQEVQKEPLVPFIIIICWLIEPMHEITQNKQVK